jgi:hypothetical protein
MGTSHFHCQRGKLGMRRAVSLAIVITLVLALVGPALAFVAGDFRTQSQGGWGSDAQGDNPGVYRDANFAAAFPGGLVVGSGNTLTFTSAEAVQAFLSQGGAPKALTESVTDPAKMKNTFASQVVALALNIGFDEYDADFGANETNLADLVIVAGEYGPILDPDTSEPVLDPETGLPTYELVIDVKFDGMTVQDVFDEANLVLGGASTEYTPSEMCDLIAAINENFVDGEVVVYDFLV